MAAQPFSFEINRTSGADPAVVFAMLSDGSRWSQWARPIVLTSKLINEGDPAPGGVGAIRKVGIGPLGLREQTVAHEQDRLHSYVYLSPVPIRNGRADVRLAPAAGGGTEITWSASFGERIPRTGPLIARALGALIGTLASKLARAAERAPRS